MLDGVYRSSEGAPVFHEARAPTGDELQALLAKIIRRILKCLTRQGALVEEEEMSYLADTDADHALTPLQAASCTYRIALGPRAGQKVLSLQRVPSRPAPSGQTLCANAHGFSRTGDKSLHAGVRCGADRHKALKHLCRTITRPAIANERLKRNRAGQVVLQLKSAYHDGTTHIVPVKGTMSCRRSNSCSASPRSRERPKCREIGPLRLINGSNHPAQERVFTRHTCD